MDFERIVVVTRKSRLQDSIQRFNTRLQAKFVIEKRGHSFSDYQLEDTNYQTARDTVMAHLPAGIKFQVIDRSYLPDFLFNLTDLVLVLGQDGLVVNTAKYLNEQAIVALNPDPDRFDGVLLPFVPADLPEIFAALEQRRLLYKKISMAQVQLNDGQELSAFNDLFLGPRSHTSARYTLSYRQQKERQSSSGVIISTPAGSTGWMSSLWNMAQGMLATKKASPAPPDWEERRLFFAVREPFASKWSGASLVQGELLEKEELVLESHMAEEGVLFSDGILEDYLEFNSGATARIGLSQRTTRLYIR